MLMIACAMLCLSCHKDNNETSHHNKRIPLQQKILGKMEHEMAKVKDPSTGNVPAERLLQAQKITEKRLKEKAEIPGINWSERGPSNISGRSKTILIDANDPTGNTIWTGGVSGGIWKSTNDGQSWSIISDQFNNMSVTSIVQDPNNPNIIYFGTGEGDSIGSFLRGNGIYRSTDGGITFSPIPFTFGNPDFEFIHKLAIQSFNGQTHLYAATSSSDLSRGGLLITQDGGTNWLIWKGDNSGSHNFACDVEVTAPDPQNNNNGAVIAAFGGFGNNIASINGGNVESDGVYVSLNGGSNWFQEFASSPNEGRIEIATAPTDPFIRYLLIESISSDLLATMYGRSFVGTSFIYSPIVMPTQGWIDQDCNNPSLDIFRGQDFYDLALAVSPANPFRLFVGGIDLWVYERNPTIFSDSWAQMTNWIGSCGFQLVHADQHFIHFKNANEVYVCNDGGVWKTNNANVNPNFSFPLFSFRGNGLNITQFFSADVHPTANTNQYITGSQDNGSQLFQSTGINVTSDVSGGDGGFAHIDQLSPNIQITSNTRQNYSVTTSAWSTGQPTQRVSTSGGRFINPTDYDDNSKKLYCANSTGNYTRWENPSSAGTTLTTVTVSGFPNIQDGAAWHIRVSPNVANRVYFGFGNGTVYRVNNAHTGSSRTAQKVFDLNLGIGHNISCVEIQPGNENHMLVTLSNFGVISVYESFNANTSNPTWRAVEGNLPDMPIRWAMFNPNNSDQAFLATEMGVWSTTNLNGNNTDWGPTNVGLSNTRIDMIKFRSSDNQMIAATHGRGLFTSDDLGNTGGCPNNLAFSNQNVSNTQRANQTITLTNTTISSSATLGAPNIDINPQFTVNNNATLQIENEGCN